MNWPEKIVLVRGPKASAKPGGPLTITLGFERNVSESDLSQLIISPTNTTNHMEKNKQMTPPVPNPELILDEFDFEDQVRGMAAAALMEIGDLKHANAALTRERDQLKKVLEDSRTITRKIHLDYEGIVQARNQTIREMEKTIETLKRKKGVKSTRKR